MAMQDPLYGLVVQTKDTLTDKSSSKTISGVNVPVMTAENKSAVGSDLDTIGSLLVELMPNKTHQKTYLNARMEVNANG